MNLYLPAAVMFLLLPAYSAHAQENVWRPIGRECAEMIDRQVGCESCGGMWPQWAECTVKTVYGDQVPEARLQACINQIWTERWREHACAACGDPVASVIACVGGAR